MSQIQRECFVCHQQVYVSKPSPTSKWIKTNLDGSEHVDPQRPRASSYQETITQDTPAIQEAKITANLRTEAIAKAHEENMQASERLAKTIEGLSSNISLLTEVITRYMERQTV